MTFTNILKALGLFNNGPPAEPSYDPKTRGTPAPAPTSKASPAAASPPTVNGYPVNNSYAPPSPAPPYNYYCESEGLKPPQPHVYNSSSASKSSSTSYADPQLPKNNAKGDKIIGENNGKRKNRKKRSGRGSGRGSGDAFKVQGNTINGGKGDKVGVFDFGNKYHKGRKRRDEDEDSSDEESDSGTEDED